MSQSPIYLDYAAATPLDERVLQVMSPYFSEQFYNPSSPYMAAKQVRKAVEDARHRVAHWLGAKPTEVIFTAGATESIAIAIHGVMQSFDDAHIVTCAIEHDAVLGTAAKYPHTIVAVQPNGLVQAEAVAAAITDKSVLVSIGYANNEIGTIQPIKAIGDMLAAIRSQRQAEGNDRPLYLHTDASQAAGYLDVHMARLGLDLITLNGAKFYGPKQSGILGIKTGTTVTSFMTGGGQESGLRSGTENVVNIVGLAAAFDLAQQNRKAAITEVAAMRDELQRQLLMALPQTVVNGSLKKRLPNNLHVSWPGIDGERLVMLLDERGVQAATGSACAANKQTESHVLKAIKLDEAHRQGSLRLSLGAPTTPQDITRAATTIIAAVNHLL